MWEADTLGYKVHLVTGDTEKTYGPLQKGIRSFL